jgi:hypothetical protein
MKDKFPSVSSKQPSLFVKKDFERRISDVRLMPVLQPV